MKLRLRGTRTEVAQATRRLVQVLEVVAVSPPYPDRGASVLVRVYLEARFNPARPSWSAETPHANPQDPSRPADPASGRCFE
jgi:hypothetical protein